MPAAKSPEFRRRASEFCLRRWKSQSDVDTGRAEGLTSDEKRELVELAADGVPVAVACRVLKVSRAGYYEWRGRPPSARQVADASVRR